MNKKTKKILTKIGLILILLLILCVLGVNYIFETLSYYVYLLFSKINNHFIRIFNNFTRKYERV